MNNKLALSAFVALLFTAACTHHSTSEPEASVEEQAVPMRIEMSANTTALLVAEMRELQEGMKQIVPALVAGEWQKISYIGNQMHDSYIMKDSLTKAELHELHESLPETFQKLDHQFHHSAALLAQAADTQNYEQVSYYYYKMTEACVECHSLYATHKFPEFIRPAK